MTQSLFADETISDHRIDALAGVLAGFIAPGYKSWADAPKRVRKPCLDAAREALETLAREVPPEHRKPKRQETPRDDSDEPLWIGLR